MGAVVEGRKPIVLIADDDEDIRNLMTFQLEGAGFEVIATEDGEEALEQARKREPDLAILDVRMPELTGIEVAQKFRAESKLSAMPIVLLTAATTPSDVIRGFEADVDDYLAKPYKAETLVGCVRTLLRSPRMK